MIIHGKHRMGIFSSLILFMGMALSLPLWAGAPTAPLKYLAVQSEGRIKPFDTQAREALAAIYGKSSYEGKPAYELMFTMILTPDAWADRDIVEIQHKGVKEALRFETTKRYFSINEIMKSDRLSLLMQDLASRRESKEKLDPYFQALQRLENQIWTFKSITAGDWLSLWPPKEDSTTNAPEHSMGAMGAMGAVGSAGSMGATGAVGAGGGGSSMTSKWVSLAEADPEKQTQFTDLTKSFLNVLNATATEQEIQDFAQAVDVFKGRAKIENPNLYPQEHYLKWEVFYNELNPFRWAWVCYLIAVLAFGLFLYQRQERLEKIVWMATLAGWAFHSLGFGLRMYLTERPPVSNMFETVVWVSWGAVLFSMVVERIFRFRYTLLAGPMVATFCLILTDMAPTILDPTLQPLEPVLRSNFWLTIHVLTITISYSAFFVAFFLGDIGLFFTWKNESAYASQLKVITNGIYRLFQIGVVLLAAGIILGGVWADYSWGRFWGWDPKETWALIALLGYLAVLHGRLLGLIGNFGMLVSAVVTFSLVIMAWYGVNYILGAGLHSYGFGAGGVEYVSAFVLIHLFLVAAVSLVRFSR